MRRLVFMRYVGNTTLHSSWLTKAVKKTCEWKQLFEWKQPFSHYEIPESTKGGRCNPLRLRAALSTRFWLWWTIIVVLIYFAAFVFRARNMPTKCGAIFPSKTKRSQRWKRWSRHHLTLWVKSAASDLHLRAAHTDTQSGLSRFLTVKSEATHH